VSEPSGPGIVLLLGGPAGAGKSTLARAWCTTRARAVHVELDQVRSLIVQGLADPQVAGGAQEEQYRVSVRASCDLARSFALAGYDVAIDDVLQPDRFDTAWRPHLNGLDWRVAIVYPRLDATLARSRGRSKPVAEHHTIAQHTATSDWEESVMLDTTGLTVPESVAALTGLIDTPHRRLE
jgi:chloramphenicol 3-O-phosphotransferase